jgi:hypothetical protein
MALSPDMFSPSKDQVRRFFIDTLAKAQDQMPMTPAEMIAYDWIQRHPEYISLLKNKDKALAADYSPEHGQINPFLHLSMHLAVSEQVSIDQPPGIRVAYQALCEHFGNEHDASHEIAECLIEQIWQQQKNGLPFDNTRYISDIQEKIKIDIKQLKIN